MKQPSAGVIAHCRQIDNQAIRAVAASQRSLTLLDIAGCSKVTHDAIHFLADWSPQLRELSLDQCKITDEILSEIARKCSQLTSLSVIGCQFMRPDRYRQENRMKLLSSVKQAH